jgi:hypothetical protein
MKLAALRAIRYVMPNIEREFEEAQRYKQLQKLSVDQWSQLVAAGHAVTANPPMLASIGNSTATSPDEAIECWEKLEPDKRARVTQALASGTIEYPIVLKIGNKMDLLSGNTRLTALVARGIQPQVWVIEI